MIEPRSFSQEDLVEWAESLHDLDVEMQLAILEKLEKVMTLPDSIARQLCVLAAEKAKRGMD